MHSFRVDGDALIIEFPLGRDMIICTLAGLGGACVVCRNCCFRPCEMGVSLWVFGLVVCCLIVGVG